MAQSINETISAATTPTAEADCRGPMLVGLILTASGFTGTIRVQIKLPDASWVDVTDEDGNVLEWTGSATVTLDFPFPVTYRVTCPTLSAGTVAVYAQTGTTR